MPTTYNLVPIPLWYMSDLVGQPLAGGYMATYRSLNKVVEKPVFNNASGQFPYPNPVFFDETGKAGPFFWASDEPYYLEFFDSQNNLFFTIDNYGPAASGGGGGGSVTITNNLENYVINNDYTSQGGVDNGSGNNTFANIQNGTVIAPSNHHGLVKNTSTGFATIPTVGPDIMYVRNNDTPTDSITFSTADFQAGQTPLTGDITPEYYINFSCSSAGSGVTLKAIQYPLVLHVKNLENIGSPNVTAIVWAKDPSGSHNLTMNLVQYFGTGSATTPVVTAIPINASPLTNGWQAYIASFSIPSVASKTLGLGGDDALYLQVCFPTTTCTIYHTKPKFYINNVASVFPEMQTYDSVDRVINSPRTGDVRLGFNNYSPFGWMPMTDGTIGDASSGATRANVDTWPLYALLYVNVSNTYAPVSGGRTSPGNTIAAAYTDFTAHKTLGLTKTLGRALASIGLPSSGGQGTTWALGQTTGEELHVLTVPELATHTHTMQGTYSRSLGSAGTTTFDRADGGTTTTSSTGSGTGHNTIQPTTYMNVFIKL